MVSDTIIEDYKIGSVKVSTPLMELHDNDVYDFVDDCVSVTDKNDKDSDNDVVDKNDKHSVKQKKVIYACFLSISCVCYLFSHEIYKKIISFKLDAPVLHPSPSG